MALKDLYRSAVLDHNRHPRNHHALAHATHQARGHNALCGDDIQVQLVIEDGQIVAAAFQGEASAITMASASMMTERLSGLTVDEALALYSALRRLLTEAVLPPEIHQILGELTALEGVREYPSRIRSATLAWAAMKAAVQGGETATTE